MLKNKRILLVEDDKELAISLKNSLKSRFSKIIDWVSSTETAFQTLDQGKTELIIADWVLADGETSLQLLEYARSYHPQTKILMLTCKSECQDRLQAYSKGADAYLCKPFELEELFYIVSRLLHSYKLAEPTEIKTEKLALYLNAGQVRVGKKLVDLRPKELQILQVLFLNRPNVVSKQKIINSVWPNIDNQPSFNTVEVYLRRLRQILSSYGIRLKNKRGYGYYFTLKSGSSH